MHIRVYFKQEGGHVHCRVYTAKAKNMTHGKAGTLVFDEAEWPVMHDVLNGIADVIPEES
jgi:hypothetical protein